MILQDLPTLKCSEQTSVPATIVYSLPSSQRIPWIHCFPVDANFGQFLSLLLAFKNTKTSRHSEIKQTSLFTKQDFSGEALSKQNTEASLASLSWNSSRAMTEWSAIFAFGVWTNTNCLELIDQKIHTPNRNIGKTLLLVLVRLFQHYFPNSYPK